MAEFRPFSVRLAPDVRDTLRAVANLTGQPLNDIVGAGVALVLAELSPKDREHLAYAVTRRGR